VRERVMKDYIVIVKLGEEAIHLEASNEDQAINKAREIIAEQYSWDLSRSNTVSYEIEGENKCVCTDEPPYKECSEHSGY